jgi:hypothetical protein
MSNIRADIMEEMIPMMDQVNLKAITGTLVLLQREVALAPRQLSSQLQDVCREHSVIVVSLEAEVARLGSRSGFSGGEHLCGSLNSDFPVDWDLVLNFLGRHTSPGYGRVGDKIEYCVFLRGLWAQGSNLTQAPPGLSLAQVFNLQKESADIHDCKSVSIDSFIFPSLLKAIEWCIQHLPGDVDQTLI